MMRAADTVLLDCSFPEIALLLCMTIHKAIQSNGIDRLLRESCLHFNNSNLIQFIVLFCLCGSCCLLVHISRHQIGSCSEKAPDILEGSLQVLTIPVNHKQKCRFQVSKAMSRFLILA
jgi:hypothetical protein